MSISRDDKIVAAHLQCVPQAEIARDVGLSRERVRQILAARLGDSTPMIQRPEVRRSVALNGLKRLGSGHSLPEAAQGLGMSVSRCQGLLRDELGVEPVEEVFDAWLASQVGSEYGLWLVLGLRPTAPGSMSKARARATVLCRGCGTVHSVGFRALESGISTRCHSCACATRKLGKPVRNAETGVEYPNIAAAAQAMGLGYSQARECVKAGEVLQAI